MTLKEYIIKHKEEINSDSPEFTLIYFVRYCQDDLSAEDFARFCFLYAIRKDLILYYDRMGDYYHFYINWRCFYKSPVGIFDAAKAVSDDLFNGNFYYKLNHILKRA